jgi:hypothetical protein
VRFGAAMPAHAAEPHPTAAASVGRRPASEPR